MRIRSARRDEVDAIAAVHYAVRNAAYADILPKTVLAADTLAYRIAMWEVRLADRAHRVFVAVDDDGRISGLASAAPMPERPQGREPLPGFDAYLESLYVQPIAHRSGAGAALLRRIALALRADGLSSLALHTLARNPARGFYEHLGARFIREERSDEHGEHWYNAAYGWPDLQPLLAPPSSRNLTRDRGTLPIGEGETG